MVRSAFFRTRARWIKSFRPKATEEVEGQKQKVEAERLRGTGKAMVETPVRREWLLLILVIGSSIATTLFGAEPGRLEIPAASSPGPASPGLQRLRSGGLLYIPKTYRPNEPLPLLILLHAAQGNSGSWFSGGHKEMPGSFVARADAERFIVLAPNAPGTTWGIGPKAWANDVPPINRAIAAAFAQSAINRDRIAIGGFSDGASYALSLGLANGDLIKAVVAFSPGFIVKAVGRGKPALFISHGREDFILPVETTKRFVAQLQKSGYAVDFHEFEGQHEVPAAISNEAMAWLAVRFRSR